MRVPALFCKAVTVGTVLFAGLGTARAITIEIDYSLDANGFFNQAGSREALRAVCDYFESILTDSLARIDEADFPGVSWTARVTSPATGQTVEFPGKVVPADVYILYAGGRDIAAAGSAGPNFWGASGNQQWFDLLRGRGEPGATATPRTDFGPWGGAVVFDSGRSWNFSQTGPGAGSSFVSIALHELGHALGIGTSDSWNTYVTGGGFTGPNATAAFGGNVPLQSGGSHWQDDGQCVFPDGHDPDNPLNVLSRTIAQFGTPGGLDQIAIMDPSSCTAGPNLRVMTELDVAGLADVGWEVPALLPPLPVLAATRNSANGNFALSWNADPARTYQVQEATALGGWANIGALIANQSGTTMFTDTNPAAGANFYRLLVDPVAPSPPVAAASSDGLIFLQTFPRAVDGCALCEHGTAH